MAEVKITDLPAITLDSFTNNDSFLIIDDGRARRLTRSVFFEWVSNNVRGERGEQGVAGRDGARGINGTNGRDGSDGLSAYQIAVQGGFVGSQSQWLASMKGSDGDTGADGGDGWSPVFRTVTVGNGSYLELIDWVGGTGEKPISVGFVSDDGIVQNVDFANNLKGEKGQKGDQGEKGEKGDRGETGSVGGQGRQGYSAYEIAMSLGFEGTEEEWALSLNPAEVSKDPNNIIKKKIDGMFAPSTDPLEMANAIDALEDKNIMTDAQKAKLEELKTSKYLGTFLTPEEIPLEGAEAGNYADVDSGEPDVDTERWIYDADSLKFVKAISVPASETSESVKEKYESNEDTNAFTDLEKEKLSTLELENSETIKAKYEENPDTNAFTDDEKNKLAGLPSEIIPETEESIKEKYESNLDTNVFTDSEKSKLESLIEETSESIKTKYESNPDTNAFTDELLNKLNTIPSEGVQGEKGDKGDSAYEIAVSSGFQGTESEWLLSLKGDKGDSTTVINVNDGEELSFWLGSQEELDLILERDPNTVYLVR